MGRGWVNEGRSDFHQSDAMPCIPAAWRTRRFQDSVDYEGPNPGSVGNVASKQSRQIPIPAEGWFAARKLAGDLRVTPRTPPPAMRWRQGHGTMCDHHAHGTAPAFNNDRISSSGSMGRCARPGHGAVGPGQRRSVVERAGGLQRTTGSAECAATEAGLAFLRRSSLRHADTGGGRQRRHAHG